MSAWICGSSALISATRGRSRLISRSFCVPMTFASSWPIMNAGREGGHEALPIATPLGAVRRHVNIYRLYSRLALGSTRKRVER